MARDTFKRRALPEWAKRIDTVRERLGLSRMQLSRELQYSAMAISRWERGIQEPPAECYIKLGKLAGEPDRWYFWERAGLSRADIGGAAPLSGNGSSNFEIVVAGAAEKKKLLPRTQFVAIPLLKVHAGSIGQSGDNLVDLRHAPIEEMIAAPVAWCPNPDSTSCLRVKGKSMSPLIHDGDILAVDTSQTAHTELRDKIVVAWHKKNGLTVSRFRRLDGLEMLESDNREYDPVILTSDRDWRIVARVLWLIRQTP